MLPTADISVGRIGTALATASEADWGKTESDDAELYYGTALLQLTLGNFSPEVSRNLGNSSKRDQVRAECEALFETIRVVEGRIRTLLPQSEERLGLTCTLQAPI